MSKVPPGSQDSSNNIKNPFTSSSSSKSSHAVARMPSRWDMQLQAYKEAEENTRRERKRAEDVGHWPFTVPREVMDMILSYTDLGIREHIALAATCTAFRRIYHNNVVWRAVIETRPVPKNGTLSYARWTGSRRDDRMLRVLATRPQKRKANGPFMKTLVEAYGEHYVAIDVVRKHRITKEKAHAMYPEVTDEHLALLKYYPKNHAGYPNQWTEEGYIEAWVEWLAIRIRNGWPVPGVANVSEVVDAEDRIDPGEVVNVQAEERTTTLSGAKRSIADDGDAVSAPKKRRA